MGANQVNDPFNDEDLKKELGEKYNELGDMFNALKDQMRRVAQ